MSTASDSADLVIRAMTVDGSWRAIAAVSTQTVQGVLRAQNALGDAASKLAQLITAAVLIREATNPARRVQITWREASGGSLVADSLPDGTNRGFASAGREEVHAQTILTVSYTHPNGSLHQGTVAAPSGDDIAAAVMSYMHQSEQTVALVALAALPSDDGVRAAGGYLVHLLPEATRETIGELTDHLGNLAPLARLIDRSAPNAAQLIEAVLSPMPFQQLSRSELRFGCTCSEERFILGILGLPEADVEEILAGGVIEARCDACGTEYRIAPDAVRAMSSMRQRRFDA
jgi:molecular chaperone Hsp33